MPTYPVPVGDKTVYITLDRKPIGLKATNEAIDAALAAGKFSESPPEQTPSFGSIMGDIGRTAARYGPPLAGISAGAALGAAQGATAGLPLSPLGPIVGGIVGSVLGGMAGYAGSEAIELGRRLATGEVGEEQKPLESIVSDVILGAGRASDVILGGGRAGLEATPPGAIATGLHKTFMEGQPVAGLSQAGLGLLGLPGSVHAIATAPTIAQQTAAAARQRISGAAERLGITLTAAEQAGTPFLESVEALLMRTGGSAGRFRRIGAEQNIQALEAAQRLVPGITSSALQEPGVRNNAFGQMLRARFEAMKRLVNMHEMEFARAAGPTAQIRPDELDPAVSTATTLKRELPTKAPTLVNSKLDHILDDIIALGQPIPGKPMTIIDAYGYPQTVTGPSQPNITTLADLRRIKTALGELAFPSKTAVSEVPQAQAQRLWGAVTESLDRFATRSGPDGLAKWQEVRQQTQNLHAMTDANWYKALLDDQKVLGDFNAALFNPNNQRVLQQAKVIVSDAGWRMIQQQYLDHVLFGPTAGAIRQQAAGEPLVLGRAFADRLTRDRRVIAELFPAESATALNELAGVLRVVDPTMSITRNRAFTTALVEYFQARGVGRTAIMAATTGTTPVQVAGAVAGAGLPWILGKVLTNPTTARLIAGATREGTLGANTAKLAVDFLRTQQAISGNEPSGE